MDLDDLQSNLTRRAQMLSSWELISEISKLWVETGLHTKTQLQDGFLEKQAQILSSEERKDEIIKLWKILENRP
jgi:hypothetical protein